MHRNKRLIIKFLTPALIMFVLIFVYPLLRTVVMSFFQVENVTSKMGSWHFSGVGNYQRLLSTKLFHAALLNLFKIWLFGGIVVMALALLFAVILNSGIKGKKFYRNVIYMPFTISAVAMASMWLQYVYNTKYGLLTTLFTKLGWEKLASIAWTDPTHKFMAMFIAYCFGMVGYHMVIFSSGIEKIPTEYYDACRIDGCDAFKQFRYMTWPLLRGVLKTNLTMWSITSVGFFVWAQMFTSELAETSTITPVVYLYIQIFGAANAVTERNAGLGAAIGVVTGVLVILAFLLINAVVKDDDFEL
jgi:multiple sugar transport system permease protein